MRFIASITMLISAVAGVSVSAQAQSIKNFKPSSAWALDYGDDYCRLMRDFSDGKETVGLFLERTQPGPFTRLIVVGDAVRLFRGAQEIGYRMYPAGGPRTTPRLRFQTASGHQYLNLGVTTFMDVNPPALGTPPVVPPPYSRKGEVDLAATITGIAIEGGLTAPVLMETGPLGDAASALQACADDLIASWGLDAEKHKALARPAIPARPTAGWIASDTVPFTDFEKLSGGNNEIRVIIDATGKAMSCHIQWPSLSAAINEKICSSVIEKAEFSPAVDQSGSPFPSYWTTSVFFLLPPFGG